MHMDPERPFLHPTAPAPSPSSHRSVYAGRVLPLVVLFFLLGFWFVVELDLDRGNTPRIPAYHGNATILAYDARPHVPLRTAQHVALCLVGGARAFELTGPSIMNYLLTDLCSSPTSPSSRDQNTEKREGEDEQGHGDVTVDIFVHSPLDDDAYKLSILKNFLLQNRSSASTGMQKNRACNFAHFRIFSPAVIPGQIGSQVFTTAGSPRGIQALLQNFYLVEGCLNMTRQYQERHGFVYDWVIRTRLDGYWNGHLPPLSTMDPTSYTIPVGSNYQGLNDRLAIGSWNISAIAMSRLSIVPILGSRGFRGLNSERSFKHLLVLNNITWQAKEFPLCVLSHRRFGWPLTAPLGIPAASISSRGPLNGAYCRPCKPAMTGPQATLLVHALDTYHAGIGHVESVELCDPRNVWEAGWEGIFDGLVSPELAELRRSIVNQNLEECLEAFESLSKQVQVWDVPPSNVVCGKGIRASH